MFRTDDLPELNSRTQTAWHGRYRGLPLDVEYAGRSRGWDPFWGPNGLSERATLPEAVYSAICYADWRTWLEGLPREEQAGARRARQIIAVESADYTLGDWGYLDLRDQAARWIDQAARERGGDAAVADDWWVNLTGEQQVDFARDVWLCAHGFRLERQLWEAVVAGDVPDPAGRQKVSPKRKRAVSKKAKTLRELLYTPRGPVRFQDDPESPEPPRGFGHCKRCKVCLAYDVNEGCCTVCGGTLSANPKGRWVDAPTFRYQLFIPRHIKSWKGLPKKLLPPRLRKGSQSLNNKPPGAFWTSSLAKEDEDPTSDWDQWMRGNMPGWAVPTGVVLEVSPQAKVKHLRTKQEAEDFLNEYGVPGMLSEATGELPRRESDLFGEGEWWGLFQVIPDWPRVVADFDALHLEGGALAHPAFYGWGAESTAWFTTKHLTEIEQIDLREGVRLPPGTKIGIGDPDDNPPPRHQRKRLSSGRLTKAENARLFRRLMKL